jgi:hypothetical protein
MHLLRVRMMVRRFGTIGLLAATWYDLYFFVICIFSNDINSESSLNCIYSCNLAMKAAKR